MRLSISVPALVATTLTLSKYSFALPVQDATTAIPAISAAPASGSTNTISLAKFYVLWYQLSLLIPSMEWEATGEFGKCQDLPARFRDNVGSIKFTSNTPSCWVYPTLGCAGDTFQDIKAPGIMVYDGPAKSFVCDIPN